MLKRAALGLGVLLSAGVVFQLLSSRRDRKRFKPPGTLVDTGRVTLHLHKQGTGEPTVVLEAGIAGSSIGWALVQPEIAKFTTVCSYDRAGLGWSGKNVGEPTVEQMARDLAELLHRSRISAPVVMVGHSFGALLARAFANLYPGLVSGLALLDPVSLNAWAHRGENDRKRLALGARLSRRGALLARFGVVRAALVLLTGGGRKISQGIGRTAAGKGSATLERLVGEVQKLPREVWPFIQSHWSEPKSFLAMAAYLECLPACAREVVKMPLPTGVPVVILSAGNASAQELDERNCLIDGHPNARHVVLEEAGHWLQLERPRDVIAAVLELISDTPASNLNSSAECDYRYAG